MNEGPNIALTASLIGDPARANMLVALMGGHALTATELAAESGITKQTASSHLSRLIDGGLLRREVQGRHHYFRLTGPEIGSVLEALMGISAKTAGPKKRPGPREPELRRARVCYDHLAGEMGVQLYEHAICASWITESGDDLTLTPKGKTAFEEFGVNFDQIKTTRRPLCRACLDWSMRRRHLSGGLGQAVLNIMFEKNWATRRKDSRVVDFTDHGQQAFNTWFAP